VHNEREDAVSDGRVDHLWIRVRDPAASKRFERPLTEHVHLAFPAQDDATVRAFHAAALAAGYEDYGTAASRAKQQRESAQVAGRDGLVGTATCGA
jgi:hypothetical protein